MEPGIECINCILKEIETDNAGRVVLRKIREIVTEAAMRVSNMILMVAMISWWMFGNNDWQLWHVMGIWAGVVFIQGIFYAFSADIVSLMLKIRKVRHQKYNIE